MPTKLTFSEGVELRNTLRDAFRSPTALNEVVFGQFEQQSSQISEDGCYLEVITHLILWTENNGKTAELIAGARKLNLSDPNLHNFEAWYTSRHHTKRTIPPPKLLRSLSRVLVTLPITEDYQGRTVLLSAIPSSNLNRSQGNRLADLMSIIDQLDNLGQLETGHWPLLLLIDNALEYARGYRVPKDTLRQIRAELEAIYR